LNWKTGGVETLMSDDHRALPHGLLHRRLLLAVVLTVAVITGVKLFCAARLELFPEEAYYWTYSKHPALGYFDHPPMVAWVIALGRAVFGDTEFGVRFGTILLSVGASLLLYFTGRLWFSQRAALWAVLLFNLAPIFVGTGLVATPDGPLLFFWLATLYALMMALRTRHTGYWVTAGLMFGGALLSKYYALLLAPSLLLFLLLAPAHRFWLRRPQPWIALALALLVFSTVIFWNAQHQWASFLFQSTRTANVSGRKLADIGTFWLTQVIILTPLLFGLFVLTVAHGLRRAWCQREERWIFAICFSMPLFLMFVAASLRTNVHINWTAPAFLSLSVPAASVFLEGVDSARRKVAGAWRVGGAITIVFCVLAILVVLGNFLWNGANIFAYSRAGGWHELATKVDIAAARLARKAGQQPFVIGADKYMIAAELGFYLDTPAECVNAFALGHHGLGYRYWTDLNELRGRPAVAVLTRIAKGREEDDTFAVLRQHFDRIDESQRIQVPTVGRHWRTLYLINCYGYHGD
jgi:dolichol-phosphate mannosyltransferase